MFSCAKAKWPTQSNVSAGFLVDYVESEDGGGAAMSNRVIPGTSYVRSTYSSSTTRYITVCKYVVYCHILRSTYVPVATSICITSIAERDEQPIET